MNPLVTSYDAFGKVSGKWKAQQFAFYRESGVANVIMKNKTITVMMPAIISEEELDENERLSNNLVHIPNKRDKIDLYSFNGKIIRSWKNVIYFACVGKWMLFTKGNKKFQITGSIIVR